MSAHSPYSADVRGMVSTLATLEKQIATLSRDVMEASLDWTKDAPDADVDDVTARAVSADLIRALAELVGAQQRVTLHRAWDASRRGVGA